MLPKKTLRGCLLAFLGLVLMPAWGQDLSLLAGATRVDSPRDNTFGVRVDYSHDLEDWLAASFTYGNEGHVPGHHRDHHAVQLWLRASMFSPQLTFAAGAGPFHYFDTTVAEDGRSFADAHGGGVIYSVAATWRNQASPWYWQARVDRLQARRNIDTTMLLVGAGYRLDQDGSFASNSSGRSWQRDRNDELTVFWGQTIVNSFESQNSAAKSVEYRRAFGPVLRGSIAWVNEGDARLIRRDGVVAQAWFEPSFYNDRFTLGLGYGAYYAVDAYRPEKQHDLMGILATTVSYNFSPRVLGRVSWHRVISSNDRDSDVILLGMGYRF